MKFTAILILFATLNVHAVEYIDYRLKDGRVEIHTRDKPFLTVETIAKGGRIYYVDKVVPRSNNKLSLRQCTVAFAIDFPAAPYVDCRNTKEMALIDAVGVRIIAEMPYAGAIGH